MKASLTTIGTVFVAAIVARFGWELGAWILHRVF